MFLLDGLLMGFAFAMPLGSQNIFVINTALAQGIPRSFRTAATVAFMDVTLGLACFFGVGAVLNVFPALRLSAALFGAAYVLWVAIELLRTPLSEATSIDLDAKNSIWNGVVARAFLLTWANPHALIDGTIILGGQRAGLESNDLFLFVCGMSGASIIWFIGLTTAIGAMRSSFSANAKRALQYICAFILIYISISLVFKSGVVGKLELFFVK